MVQVRLELAGQEPGYVRRTKWNPKLDSQAFFDIVSARSSGKLVKAVEFLVNGDRFFIEAAGEMEEE